MRILFVSSGNVKKFGISPIVTNQGQSLSKRGVNVSYFGIKGKGFFSYISSIKKIRELIKNSEIDLIHAHYSLSGLVTSIASFGRLPVVVSLMGSDMQRGGIYGFAIKFASHFLWRKTIVKSLAMLKGKRLKHVAVLPNGVDFEMFRPEDKQAARNKVGFQDSKAYIIFIANPSRPEKNVKLAREAMAILNRKVEAEFFVVFGEEGIEHDQIPNYLNAANVLILTSLYEGSPNVIKEAMACNCPIVSTKVGDVEAVIKDTHGCFVTSFSADEIAAKLELALNVEKSNGRQNIAHLESQVISKKLIDVYHEVLN